MLSVFDSTYGAACIAVTEDDILDRIDDGIDTILVFAVDTELRVSCVLELDVLIIAEGGDSGGDNGDDSIFWATLGGEALDPDIDTPPEEHKAFGGGAGALDDRDGNSGGSGGAGGGSSPSGNAMWTVGGQGVPGQGHNAGGGRSTWGLLDAKAAASGGGGGYGVPGTGAEGPGGKAGLGGAGGVISGWNWRGPKGGNGRFETVPTGDTGDISGGGGSGGVLTLNSFTIQPAQVIPIRVGGNGSPGGGAGTGGRSPAGSGIAGIIAIRIRTAVEDSAAALSGGVETDDGGYRYHTFTSSGTITVDTPGAAEVLVIGGGAGGGSDCGAGGGGGGVRLATVNLESNEAVTVGDGGAGGSSGAVGSNGEDSSVGELVVAYGGGGGAGQGTAAGSRATGGGGHGVDGSPGTGLPLRGYPGGSGAGFNLSAGGSAASAGGGGGAGGEGDFGAEAETQGDELVDHWEVPTAGTLMLADREYRIIVGGTDQATLIGTDVAVETMMVQGRVKNANSKLRTGIMARARHPTGDPDEDATGYWAAIGNQVFITSAGDVSFFQDLSEWNHVQIYAEDDVQEYSAYGPPVGPTLVRKAGTDAGENGNVRSFGFRGLGAVPTGGSNKQGFCDHIMCFKSKYLEVGSLSTGDYIEVLDLSGAVVATAVESSGTALVDLSMYGDGSDGATEPVPLAGWGECIVKDSGGSEIAEALGSFYPGGEFDLSGSTLDIRIDSSGPEPIPVTGLLQRSDFDELTPGPENGDGGVGREVAASWLTVVPGDDGVFGGGGGGGSEIVLAGEGGDGGGGAGSVDTASPVAGTTEIGGGGGGSGDAATSGAAGGSGQVVIRTVL